MTTKTSKRAPAKAPTKAKDGTNVLQMASSPDVTPERQMADLVTAGEAGNAWLTALYGKGTFGELSLTQCVHSLRQTTAAVKGGDLSTAETLLASQAIALNAMFGELSRRASLNMGEYIDASERYMRLALKAQGQCRATLETLAAIKNPPVVFARQANISNGGQQQVNNGPARTNTPASAHAPKTVSEPNELIEDLTHGRTHMDTRTTAAAGGANPHLEPVGAIHRPAKP